MVSLNIVEEALIVWEIKEPIEEGDEGFEDVKKALLETYEQADESELKKKVITIDERSPRIPYRPMIFARIPFGLQGSTHIDKVVRVSD